MPKPTNSKCSFQWSAENGEMPNFKIAIKSDQAEKTVLHIVIWRAEGDADGIKDSAQIGHDVDMFCEAHIPLMKILEKDLNNSPDDIRNSLT